MENSKQPAYPIVGMAFNEETKGLTKRELTAAMAMQGLMANSHESVLFQSGEQISKWAVSFTDALLSELDKPTYK